MKSDIKDLHYAIECLQNKECVAKRCKRHRTDGSLFCLEHSILFKYYDNPVPIKIWKEV